MFYREGRVATHTHLKRKKAATGDCASTSVLDLRPCGPTSVRAAQSKTIQCHRG
jgi:hypothetical protein